MSPDELAVMIQKVYLGVGAVISDEGSRPPDRGRRRPQAGPAAGPAACLLRLPRRTARHITPARAPTIPHGRNHEHAHRRPGTRRTRSYPDAPGCTAGHAPAAPPAQDGTDWKAEARKWEERAKANKAELDAHQQQIADSQKTAEQKAADAAADAAAAKLEALRWQVAATKGLDPILATRLTGSSKEELGRTPTRSWHSSPKAPRRPRAPAGPTVPGQQPGGTNPPAVVTQADLDALAAEGKYDEINRLRREDGSPTSASRPPKG